MCVSTPDVPGSVVSVIVVSDKNFAYWHSATFNNDGTIRRGNTGTPINEQLGVQYRYSIYNQNLTLDPASPTVGTEFTKLQPDPSLRADAETVTMKIRSVLPEPVRDYIDTLQQRTVELEEKIGMTGFQEFRRQSLMARGAGRCRCGG